MSRRPRYTGQWGSVDCTCNILDKKKSIFNYIMYMFDRTNMMFEYENLPDTIPKEMLELYLQMNGHVCITEVNGKLYALPGGLGGAPDPYYRPTLYVVANPGLGYSASLKILNHLAPFGEQSTQGECVLIKNDTMLQGTFYLNSRYATELAENDVSIRSAQINTRQQTVIIANSDQEAASAQAYIDSLVDGKLASMQGKKFSENVLHTENVSVQSANLIIQLIELQQYLKASWFNEIGINANFNMKREYLSEEEIKASTDVLLPLIDNMLECRESAIDLVNSTYGTNIKVSKSSAWLNKQEEVDTEELLKEAEIQQLDPDMVEPEIPKDEDSEKEEEKPTEVEEKSNEADEKEGEDDE